MIEKLSQLQKKPTSITLLLANLVPIIGVLFFDWDVFHIMLLYWSESAIIGFYTICKIITAGVYKKEFTISKPKGQPAMPTIKGIGAIALYFFMSVFFTVHYGGFMFGHLFFIVAIFGPEGPFSVAGDFISWSLLIDTLKFVWIGVIALFISHGISFYKNYINGKEFTKANPQQLMGIPYIRIVAMHITLIIGGGLIMVFGIPAIGLVLLIILKVIFDTKAHLKEHKFKKVEKGFAEMPQSPKKQSRRTPIVIFFIVVIFAIVIVFLAVNQDDNQEFVNNSSVNNTASTGVQLSTEDTIVFDEDNNLIMTDLTWDKTGGRFLMVRDGSMMELFVDDKNVIDWNKSFVSMTGDYVLRGWAGPYIVNKAAMQIDMNQGGEWPLDKNQKDPSALTQQGQYLWVADSATNKLYKYDINQNYTLVDSYPADGTAVVGVAWDGTNLWSADVSMVYKYNADMTANERFNLPVLISGLTVRNNELWATASSESKIYNISIILK